MSSFLRGPCDLRVAYLSLAIVVTKDQSMNESMNDN